MALSWTIPTKYDAFFRNVTGINTATKEEAAKYLIGNSFAPSLRDTHAFRLALLIMFEGLLERAVIPYYTASSANDLRQVDLQNYNALGSDLSSCFKSYLSRTGNGGEDYITWNRWKALITDTWKLTQITKAKTSGGATIYPLLTHPALRGTLSNISATIGTDWSSSSTPLTVNLTDANYQLPASALIFGVGENACDTIKTALQVLGITVSDKSSSVPAGYPFFKAGGYLQAAFSAWDTTKFIDGLKATKNTETTDFRDFDATPRLNLDVFWACQVALGYMAENFVILTPNISNYYVIDITEKHKINIIIDKDGRFVSMNRAFDSASESNVFRLGGIDTYINAVDVTIPEAYSDGELVQGRWTATCKSSPPSSLTSRDLIDGNYYLWDATNAVFDIVFHDPSPSWDNVQIELKATQTRRQKVSSENDTPSSWSPSLDYYNEVMKDYLSDVSLMAKFEGVDNIRIPKLKYDETLNILQWENTRTAKGAIHSFQKNRHQVIGAGTTLKKSFYLANIESGGYPKVDGEDIDPTFVNLFYTIQDNLRAGMKIAEPASIALHPNQIIADQGTGLAYNATQIQGGQIPNTLEGSSRKLKIPLKCTHQGNGIYKIDENQTAELAWKSSQSGPIDNGNYSATYANGKVTISGIAIYAPQSTRIPTMQQYYRINAPTKVIAYNKWRWKALPCSFQ